MTQEKQTLTLTMLGKFFLRRLFAWIVKAYFLRKIINNKNIHVTNLSSASFTQTNLSSVDFTQSGKI